MTIRKTRPGLIVALLGMAAVSACGGSDPAPAVTAASEPPAEDVVRYPIPNSDFPIARAVEVPAGKTLVFVSGQVPAPAQPEAERFSAEFWGDTEQQSLSSLQRVQAALQDAGLDMQDVVKMNVYLVGTPETGRLDFDGFMKAYTRFFGPDAQPNLPARAVVQVAGLAAPGMLVEIEVIAARP